jgi:multisubunit Na+/H+ antiporter MnhC subunit
MGPKERIYQRLRLRRFAMAVATYCIVILALYVVTLLGIGTLSPFIWALVIGLCLTGNGLLLFLFITGRNLRFSDPSLTSQQIIFAAFWGMIPMWTLPMARPVVLMFFLPALGFGMLRLNLRQYLVVVIWYMTFYGLILITEFLTKRAGFRLEYELFLYVLFAILLIWVAFFGGFVSRLRRELRKEIDIRRRAEKEKDRLILDLENALGEIKTLSGLLPICANCKKIRDSQGYWNQVENYLSEHSDADFSHSICPECAAKLYPNYDFSIKPKAKE